MLAHCGAAYPLYIVGVRGWDDLESGPSLMLTTAMSDRSVDDPCKGTVRQQHLGEYANDKVAHKKNLKMKPNSYLSLLLLFICIMYTWLLPFRLALIEFPSAR